MVGPEMDEADSSPWILLEFFRGFSVGSYLWQVPCPDGLLPGHPSHTFASSWSSLLQVTLLAVLQDDPSPMFSPSSHTMIWNMKASLQPVPMQQPFLASSPKHLAYRLVGRMQAGPQPTWALRNSSLCLQWPGTCFKVLTEVPLGFPPSLGLEGCPPWSIIKSVGGEKGLLQRNIVTKSSNLVASLVPFIFVAGLRDSRVRNRSW